MRDSGLDAEGDGVAERECRPTREAGLSAGAGVTGVKRWYRPCGIGGTARRWNWQKHWGRDLCCTKTNHCPYPSVTCPSVRAPYQLRQMRAGKLNSRLVLPLNLMQVH